MQKHNMYRWTYVTIVTLDFCQKKHYIKKMSITTKRNKSEGRTFFHSNWKNENLDQLAIHYVSINNC